jgi:O-antigen/teichoic acid export membrane protein
MNLNYRSDIFIIKWLLTNKELGLYGLSVSLTERLWMLPQAVGLVTFAKIANTAENRVHSVTPRVCRVTLFMSCVAGLVLYFTIPSLLPFLYGEAFADAVDSFRILLPGSVLMAIFLVLHGDLAGRGKAHYTIFIFAPGLLANTALNLLLIPKAGIAGAAFASSATYGICALLLALLYAQKNNLSLINLIFIQKMDIEDILRPLFHRLRLDQLIQPKPIS